MEVRLEFERYIGEKIGNRVPPPEWKLDGNIRSFEHTATFIEQPVYQAMKEWCGYGKSGFQEILDPLLHLPGQD